MLEEMEWAIQLAMGVDDELADLYGAPDDD